MKKETLKVFYYRSCCWFSEDVHQSRYTNHQRCLVNQKKAGIRTIYLVQGSSQLSENDLADHPEVLVVYTFKELQDIAANNVVDLWIDKDAVDLVDPDWLHQETQKYYPVVNVSVFEINCRYQMFTSNHQCKSMI